MVLFRVKIFDFKRIPVLGVMPLSASFCGFVLLTNMSLQYNSVGFFQVCKVLTTPVIVLIQLLVFKKSNSSATLVTLAIICVGVLIATTTDVELNVLGTVIAIAGVLVTSFYQIVRISTSGSTFTQWGDVTVGWNLSDQV